MTDEKWEELEAIAVSTIHLSLTLEIMYNILNEKSPFNLWEKLEKIICQNLL